MLNLSVNTPCKPVLYKAFMVTNPIDRLFEEARERDFSDADLARFLGITQQRLHNWRARGSIPTSAALEIERKFGWPPGRLVYGTKTLGTAEPHAAYNTDSGVPVVGTAQAGDDGYWDELQYPVGHGDGFIRYPSRDANCYALRVKGDSMRPRIKPGEFLIIEPNSPTIPGEEVLVTTVHGKSMVKILGPQRDGMVELQSVNEDHRPITLDRSEIRFMHYIAAIVKANRYYRDG